MMFLIIDSIVYKKIRYYFFFTFISIYFFLIIEMIYIIELLLSISEIKTTLLCVAHMKLKVDDPIILSYSSYHSHHHHHYYY